MIIKIMREMKSFSCIISVLLFFSTITLSEILTVEEGDTLYLVDLIKSGDYIKYMDLIEVEGCSVEDDVLYLGEDTGMYGFSIGILSVGFDDNRWRNFEISGRFLIPEGDETPFYIYIHKDTLGRSEGIASVGAIEIIPYEEIRLYDIYDDRIQKEYWEELSEEKPKPSPDVWYKFKIVVKGSSVFLYIDDILSVSSIDLSSQNGGFKMMMTNFNESGYQVGFEDLKVKVNKFK